MARMDAAGFIHFHDRLKDMIKTGGLNVFSQEVEYVLSKHPAVREAVVLAREDAAGDKRLVAYVTSVEAARDAPAVELVATLRRHLAEQLPDYMVPAAFVRIDALPLTPNGKLDRKALPAPDSDAVVAHAYEPPRGHIEETLAAIWSELLGVPRVGRHDHFFELGGHSLLAVRLQTRMREVGVDISLQELFDKPVLSALVASQLVKVFGEEEIRKMEDELSALSERDLRLLLEEEGIRE